MTVPFRSTLAGPGTPYPGSLNGCFKRGDRHLEDSEPVPVLKRLPNLGGCFRLLAILAIGTAAPLARAQAPAQAAPKPAPDAKPQTAAASDALRIAFTIAHPASLLNRPITARVYVMLSPGKAGAEPRFGPDWFRPQPFFSREVKDWKSGETIRIDETATGFPGPLSTLAAGEYRAQAVIRLNPDTHEIGNGEGNAYGPVVPITIHKGDAATFPLVVDTIVPPRPFQETDRVKLAELESPMLSAFHHRPIKHRAAVILPEAKPARKLPTVYIIPGFGGDHHAASRYAASSRMAFGKDLIRVLLDPDCGTGHHVFADSATNGPRGKALVEEFIPYLEKTFPMVADPKARLLNGHSSGGWSSLWLQVTYPDVFAGTWSTSPDPVDFRDFQRINIYSPGENVFHDRQNQRRPIARMGVMAVLYYDRFSKMEEAMGPGGQLGSFEAVFSPLDGNGQPRRLWNRDTGAIDPETARAWEPYDIRLVLERNWPTLGPKLKGKLHVITGGMDTFYLEGAVKLLDESLKALKSDAVIEIVPNRDHGTILDRALSERIDREMKAAVAPFLESK